MPQLDISTFLPQLFWLFISFGLLYFLRSKLCLAKIATIMEQRDLSIADNLKSAHLAKDQAVKLKSEYEAILLNSAKARSDNLAKVSKELSQMIDDKLVSFDKELNNLVLESEKRMKAFEATSENEIEEIAKKAALAILANIDNINLEEELVSKAIKKIKSEGSYVI